MIRERGWCQGKIQHRDSNEVDALDAIDVALREVLTFQYETFDEWWPIRVKRLNQAAWALKSVLDEGGWGEWESVDCWNDFPLRTIDEILVAFRKAASLPLVE